MNNYDNSVSVSKFLLPFYYDHRSKKKTILPINEADFTRYDIKTKYLVESVRALFSSNGNEECRCYYLNSDVYGKYGLPERFANISMRSEMIGCPGEFTFSISGIRVYYFETGIGFLELETQYPKDDTDRISDIGFCLSNVFTNEHDSEGQINRLSFSYGNADSRTSFSVKNCLYNILDIEKKGDSIRLFPTGNRKRLLMYHSLFSSTPATNKQLYALCNGLHSNVHYDEVMDDNIIFSSVLNQSWAVSSTGVASIAYLGDNNRSFLEKTFRKNSTYDYFYVFLLVAHEREILLKYNFNAVQNRKNPKALVKMKKDLLKLQILYTYNTVSTESVYQRFYDNLAQKFNISSLEADIRDVVENVESHVNDKKDRKVNTILTALSILAVFSVLIDGISFADRIESGDSFGALQWGIVGVVVVVIFVAIILFRSGDK